MVFLIPVFKDSGLISIWFLFRMPRFQHGRMLSSNLDVFSSLSLVNRVSYTAPANLAVSPEVEMVELAVLKQLEQEITSKTNGSKVPRFFRL